MKKLNNEKIRWIIRQKDKRAIKNADISFSQKVTVRRINQLYSEYTKTGIMPVLKKCGRKPKLLTEEQKKIIDDIRDEYKVGPLGLEKVIQRKYNVRIPHNAIYKHLLSKGQVMENSKKKK
ncbi:IS481 family transposase, partial [archaeon]|nr:IS481 family transposase [Nanoarchaeota archaeon]MCG2724188.1 IS481 family transposase [archaeon]